jgi:hypothetical protein
MTMVKNTSRGERVVNVAAEGDALPTQRTLQPGEEADIELQDDPNVEKVLQGFVDAGDLKIDGMSKSEEAQAADEATAAAEAPTGGEPDEIESMTVSELREYISERGGDPGNAKKAELQDMARNLAANE